MQDDAYTPGYVDAYAGDIPIRDISANDGNSVTVNFPPLSASNVITFVVCGDLGRISNTPLPAALLGVLESLPFIDAASPTLPNARGAYREGNSTSYTIRVIC